MGKKDYINNTKFPKTTIQNKISHDLGNKSKCDKADVSRQKIKDIRNCSHYLSPTPSLYPPPPKKKNLRSKHEANDSNRNGKTNKKDVYFCFSRWGV